MKRKSVGETGIGVTISSHSTSISQLINNAISGNIVQQIKKQSDRDRAQYVQLVDQYRAIGPAALVAALLHSKKRKTAAIASKAA